MYPAGTRRRRPRVPGVRSGSEAVLRGRGLPAAAAAVRRARVATDPRRPGALALSSNLPAYPLFQWLERNTQKMMWRRLEAMIRPRAAELELASNARRRNRWAASSSIRTSALPDYYAHTEFHIQPGGVWSGAANAFVYELGARVVMMGQNDDYRFHRLFVETAIPRQDYRAILDLGCGFGKSTRPFVDAFPQATRGRHRSVRAQPQARASTSRAAGQTHRILPAGGGGDGFSRCLVRPGDGHHADPRVAHARPAPRPTRSAAHPAARRRAGGARTSPTPATHFAIS